MKKVPRGSPGTGKDLAEVVSVSKSLERHGTELSQLPNFEWPWLRLWPSLGTPQNKCLNCIVWLPMYTPSDQHVLGRSFLRMQPSHLKAPTYFPPWGVIWHVAPTHVATPPQWALSVAW